MASAAVEMASRWNIWLEVAIIPNLVVVIIKQSFLIIVR
jgi:hypothetical protein